MHDYTILLVVNHIPYYQKNPKQLLVLASKLVVEPLLVVRELYKESNLYTRDNHNH